LKEEGFLKIDERRVSKQTLAGFVTHCHQMCFQHTKATGGGAFS